MKAPEHFILMVIGSTSHSGALSAAAIFNLSR
jgi:hypothetical protein